MKALYRKKAVSRIALVIAVVIVIVIASIGAYYGFVVSTSRTSTTSTPAITTSTPSITTSTPAITTSTPSITTSTPAITTSTPSITTTSTTSTTKSARTSMQVDESEQPDSLDPAVTYETSGWEVVEQIYQGLLAPNGSSNIVYQAELASAWTISPSAMNYTFVLRPNVSFSNGDPFNAYVEWYSVYRTLVMDQSPSWILAQNLAAGNGRTFNVTDSMLNSINYFNPSPDNLTVMSRPDQSVVVLNASAIQFNLGYGYNGMNPYSAFLATLITPMTYAVDPAFVGSHGGVVAGAPNGYMTTEALGTGFYELQSWVMGQSVSLVKNPNYWANNLPKSQLNDAISPAILNTIVIYYKDSATSIADLGAGTVQMISVPVTYYNVTTRMSGVTTSVLPIVYGSSEDVHYVYMDTQAFPIFNNINVRKAIANAIDYQDIIRLVFGGHAQQWIGPVPPGFQYYNESTAGLSPYQYNPIQAAVSLAQAGFVSHLPNGTTLNPSGRQFPTVAFLYDSDDPTDDGAAEIISSNLGSIGIPVTLKSLPFREYAALIDSSSSENTTYAMGFAYYSEDYTASVDYVSYFVTANEIGSSAYVDSQAINWTIQAATATNSSTIITAFHSITQRMYQNYTDIWLYVPEMMAVRANGITGIIPNPAGSGMGYFMFYNTISYTS